MALRNKRLARLSRQELEVVSPDLEPAPLSLKRILRAPHEPIEHVFFVESGVVSMVNEPESGDIVEFATIGPEGLWDFRFCSEPILSRAARSRRFRATPCG